MQCQTCQVVSKRMLSTTNNLISQQVVDKETLAVHQIPVTDKALLRLTDVIKTYGCSLYSLKDVLSLCKQTHHFLMTIHSRYFFLPIVFPETLAYIVVLMLTSIDFWIVKNIVGRKLIKMRWWFIIDNEGNERWFYESKGKLYTNQQFKS